MTTVVLLPGFQGRADQPILRRLEARLVGGPPRAESLRSPRAESRGDLTCLRRAPPRLKLTPDLEAYVDWLEAEVSAVRGPLILVGRSFGGRLAIRLAARRKLAAVVLLGFPIRPPGKRRPLDEQALAALTCPAWIAQGTKDELGPMKVLRQFSGTAEVFPVVGAGHSFGAKESATLDAAAKWIRDLSPSPEGERASADHGPC
ncbi:MAG: dienelactone hydrolase family protein [Archangium sp.]|nr:dienelactone hydrolase family protein [Archangium sp.]